MGKRGSQSVHDTHYKWLIQIYGETCVIDNKPPPAGEKLQIDHVDDDPEHYWDPDNIALVCAQCNIYLRGVDASDPGRPAQHRIIIRHYSALRVRERARASASEKSTTRIRQGVSLPVIDRKIAREFHRVVKKSGISVPLPDFSTKEVFDYMSGDPAMKANSRYQPAFAVWLWKELMQHGPLTQEDILNSGANDIGANQTTLKRYLDAWCSRKGALMKIDEGGEWKIYFKDPITARKISRLDEGVKR